MNDQAFNILANKGLAAFIRHCEAERDVAQATGYVGAAEYWQNQIDRVKH